MKQKLIEKIKENCFVNAPWYLLKNRYLDFFLQERIQPEIGLEGLCLYDEEYEEFKSVAESLAKHNLDCTLHAPFLDLAPGALDPFILDHSREKLSRAFELIPLFQPKSMVCHLQFEENKHSYVFDDWFAAFVGTYQPLLDLALAKKVPIMFENTFETSPRVHRKVLEHFNSPYVGFCLDVGHLMAFSNSDLQQWLTTLSPWFGQLHLHDNHGKTDDHLAPGRGIFNFDPLIFYLNEHALHPIITLEPHSEEDLQATFDYLLETNLLKDIAY